MGTKYEPGHRDFSVGEDAASNAFFQGSPTDTPTFIPDAVGKPTAIPGMVDGGSSIVPAEVDRGLIPPLVDKRGT